MIRIEIHNISKLVHNHYEQLKSKVKSFPSCSYTLQEIITAPPDKLQKIAKKYKNDHSFDFMVRLYTNFTNKKQEYDAYDLAESLNINVCPYCNRNYTLTVKSKYGSTRPQFDHFYDKDTYPILALSFYNIIPSCSVCNGQMKGKKTFSLKTHIHPYVEGFDKKSRFKLHIQNCSFYYDNKGFEVKMQLQNEREKNNFRDFGLEKLYERHSDIVLELIQKAQIYNESYLDELMQNYEGTLFRNRDDLLRLVTCGYVVDEDLHKRPLSKLIKDISEELDLL